MNRLLKEVKTPLWLHWEVRSLFPNLDLDLDLDLENSPLVPLGG